LTVQVLM